MLEAFGLLLFFVGAFMLLKFCSHKVWEFSEK